MEQRDWNKEFTEILEGKREVEPKRGMTAKEMCKLMQRATSTVIKQLKKDKVLYDSFEIMEFSIQVTEEGLAFLSSEVVYYKKQEDFEEDYSEDRMEWKEYPEIVESLGRKQEIKEELWEFFEIISKLNGFTVEIEKGFWEKDNFAVSIYVSYKKDFIKTADK